LDGPRIRDADGQGLFHYHGNAMSGTNLYDVAMVKGIRVRHHRLGMRFLQHLFQVGKEQTGIQSITFGITGGERLVRLGYANKLDIGTLRTLPKESPYMPVHESRDTDPKR